MTHEYIESGSGFCARCDAMPGEGVHVSARMMSTGVPSTLGNWYAMSKAFFGEDSKATLFLKEKMDAQGPNEEVISDEGQLLHALVMMDRDDDART